LSDVVVGSYAGDGGITQEVALTVGWGKPDLTFVQAFSAMGPPIAEDMYIRMATEGPGHSQAISTSDPSILNGIVGEDTDRITIGSTLNSPAQSYFYCCVRGEGLGSDANFASGTYVGDDNPGRLISTGQSWKPDLIIITMESYSGFTTWSVPNTGVSSFFNDAPAQPDIVLDILDAEFMIGGDTSANKGGVVYSWVAFRSLNGSIDVGQYSGDASPGRDITLGSSFTPEFALINTRENAFAADRSSPMLDPTSNRVDAIDQPNLITEFQADRIRIGDGSEVNQGGFEYDYLALAESVPIVTVLADTATATTSAIAATFTTDAPASSTELIEATTSVEPAFSGALPVADLGDARRFVATFTDQDTATVVVPDVVDFVIETPAGNVIRVSESNDYTITVDASDNHEVIIDFPTLDLYGETPEGNWTWRWEAENDNGATCAAEGWFAVKDSPHYPEPGS